MPWYEQLDTNEKLIAFLRSIGRDDLAAKFEAEGCLYLNDLERELFQRDQIVINNGDFINFANET